MSLIGDLTPINLEEEKQKFFDQDCNYNPQFKYKKLITINMLYRYGKPNPKYSELAKELLEKAFHNRTEEDIRKMEGELLTKEKADLMIQDFLSKNDMVSEISVRWSDKFPGKASYYVDTLKLRLPVWHREKEFLGTLYHELGTHALRRINYAQQPFFKKKSQYGFGDYLTTEEGLASFHTLLVKNFKIDYTSVLKYCACEVAETSSFVKTYNFINNYLQDPERTWLYTYNQKRGLYDTKEAGGFTKNITYFEGLAQVWEYFRNSNFDVESLYYGKIAAEDINLAKELNPDYKPRLPTFIKNNFEQYTSKITEIAQTNLLDSISS